MHLAKPILCKYLEELGYKGFTVQEEGCLGFPVIMANGEVQCYFVKRWGAFPYEPFDISWLIFDCDTEWVAEYLYIPITLLKHVKQQAGAFTYSSILARYIEDVLFEAGMDGFIEDAVTRHSEAHFDVEDRDFHVIYRVKNDLDLINQE